MAKPMVDGLESELGDRGQVVRLNLSNDVGRNAAIKYGIRQVPTFVIVDGAGQTRLVEAGRASKSDLWSVIEPLLKSQY